MYQPRSLSKGRAGGGGNGASAGALIFGIERHRPSATLETARAFARASGYSRGMASPVHPSDFKEALIILGAAGVVVPLFHRLRVSPVLGFMIVGMAVGPSGFGALARDVPWLSAVTITDASAIGPRSEEHTSELQSR